MSDGRFHIAAIYTRNLEKLDGHGVVVVSSKRLAELCRVNPAQIRKDLAYFGQFGDVSFSEIEHCITYLIIVELKCSILEQKIYSRNNKGAELSTPLLCTDYIKLVAN